MQTETHSYITMVSCWLRELHFDPMLIDHQHRSEIILAGYLASFLGWIARAHLIGLLDLFFRHSPQIFDIVEVDVLERPIKEPDLLVLLCTWDLTIPIWSKLSPLDERNAQDKQPRNSQDWKLEPAPLPVVSLQMFLLICSSSSISH